MKKLIKTAIVLFGVTTLGFAGFGAYAFADNFWQGHNDMAQINNDLYQLSQIIQEKNGQLTKKKDKLTQAKKRLAEDEKQLKQLKQAQNQQKSDQDSQDNLSQAVKEAKVTREYADTLVKGALDTNTDVNNSK